MAELLHAAYWTHAGDIGPLADNYASPVDLRRRAEACAAAGFGGMGFATDDMEALILRHGPAELKRIFADNGIVNIEIEALMGWTDPYSAPVDEMLRLAEASGAIQIKAVGLMDAGTDRLISGEAGSITPEDMAEPFAKTCDRFADLGAKVVIELMAISNLNTLAKGRAVVEGADRANGGLLIDSWHRARCRIDYADIADLPPGVFLGTEICGGPEEPCMDDPFTEMIDCRQFPGEGEFDNVAFIRAARSAGFNGPWGTEVLSHEIRAMPVEQALERAAQGLRALLAEAG